MTNGTFRLTIRMCLSLLMLAAAIAINQSAPAQSSQIKEGQRPPALDHQSEIALALSACPPSVASEAAVYVLERSGYTKVRDSQNGFTAIVQHSMPASQEPQCMDAEGARTLLPRYLREAAWRAQGKSSDEIKLLVADAFAKGIFSRLRNRGLTTCFPRRTSYQTQKERSYISRLT